jgi:hypothetical protein
MSVTLQSLRELRVLLDSLGPTCINGPLSERLPDPTQKPRHTGEAPSDDPPATLLYKAECSVADEMVTDLRNGRPLDIPVNRDLVSSGTDFSDT